MIETQRRCTIASTAGSAGYLENSTHQDTRKVALSAWMSALRRRQNVVERAGAERERFDRSQLGNPRGSTQFLQFLACNVERAPLDFSDSHGNQAVCGILFKWRFQLERHGHFLG